MDASFNCQDCSMSFRSEGLLEKHRRLFCVRADEEDKIEEEENENEKEQEILKARVMELERLKRRKSELRKDREEREKQLLMNERETARPSSESLWERKSSKLLQKTEDRRKDVEKPREDQPWNRASTVSSASVELPPTSTLPTPMINSSEQIIELVKMETDSYNKKLAQHRQQMEELIVQKRAIDNRLREFEEEKTRPVAMNMTIVEQLMTQQEENQATLMRLQHNQSMKTSGNDPHSLTEKKQPDFLLKQINVVRQRYLDSGGCNPDILLDIAAMERDALNLLEKHLEVDQVELQNKEKHRVLNEELEAFEIDNQRLEEELINLHEANTDKLELQVNDFE